MGERLASGAGRSATTCTATSPHVDAVVAVLSGGTSGAGVASERSRCRISTQLMMSDLSAPRLPLPWHVHGRLAVSPRARVSGGHASGMTLPSMQPGAASMSSQGGRVCRPPKMAVLLWVICIVVALRANRACVQVVGVAWRHPRLLRGGAVVEGEARRADVDPHARTACLPEPAAVPTTSARVRASAPSPREPPSTRPGRARGVARPAASSTEERAGGARTRCSPWT